MEEREKFKVYNTPTHRRKKKTRNARALTAHLDILQSWRLKIFENCNVAFGILTDNLNSYN